MNRTISVVPLAITFVACFAMLCLTPSTAWGRSFSLDDDPSAPLTSPPGLIPGFGAEDEFGVTGGGALTPSPSLGLLMGLMGPPVYDGSIISPAVPPPAGPPFFPPPLFLPNGGYIDAFSTNHAGFQRDPIRIDFSVDRTSVGGGALGAEAMLNQHMGDIYRSTAVFPSPINYVGTMAALPAPFAGVLPSAGVGGLNTLAIDESALGLTVTGVPGALTPPGVPAAPLGPGVHDNVDAFDHTRQVAMPGGGPGAYAGWSYFAVAPDEAVTINLGGGGPTGIPISAADLFDVPPMTPVTNALAYAPAPSMGLDTFGLNTDSIDALVLWDLGQLGGPWNGGPGAQRAIDFALFSLAPGSASLAPPGAVPLDAADVFFTDFSGNFAVYAFATDLAIGPAPGGPPFGPSNIDALEVVPEPSTLALAAIGVLGLLAYAWRRRRCR